MTITHPAHPLRGQSFMGKNPKGRSLQAVIIELSEGEERLIPLEWTDQVPVRARLTEARFVLRHLQLLRQQVDELLSRAASNSIITSKKVYERSGGNDVGSKETQYLAEVERVTAPTGAGSPGPDVATSVYGSAREQRS